MSVFTAFRQTGRRYLPSEKDEELRARAAARVRKLSTSSLLDWADAAGSGMSKGFDDFRRHGDYEAIAEIALGLITLEAVVYELKARAEAERR